MRKGQSLALVGALALAMGLSACGGDSGDDKDSAGKGGGLEGHGPITLATGKDTTGTLQAQLDAWNKDHPSEKVTLNELPESADQQRQQFIQNAQTKSDAYTVLNMDVVWTAEFAANQWIDELPADKFDLNKMIPAVVETGKYFKKQYAIPYNTNAGLLFYRKDLLDKVGAQAPKTWDEMKATCDKVKALPEGKDLSCYAGQYDKYEGLTVNFSEAVQSAGGKVVDDAGKPTVNSPEAKKGLQTLVDAFGNGTISQEAVTYKEEEGRRAFQAGKVLFHRNWPYVWTLGNKTDGSSQVAGKFAVGQLPGIAGPGRSTLGGANLAISKFGKNKATAVDFIKFLTNEANAKQNLQSNSLAPVFPDLYTDASMTEKFPYLPALKESL